MVCSCIMVVNLKDGSVERSQPAPSAEETPAAAAAAAAAATQLSGDGGWGEMMGEMGEEMGLVREMEGEEAALAAALQAQNS
jgi:predicted lipid-binding transport protein (Tim44 family)